MRVFLSAVVFSSIVAAISLCSAIPASAQSQYPGYGNQYGGYKTTTLWAYSVPGATVGVYQYRCETLERQKFPGTQISFNNRPGRVWGSNEVSCTATSAWRRG